MQRGGKDEYGHQSQPEGRHGIKQIRYIAEHIVQRFAVVACSEQAKARTDDKSENACRQRQQHACAHSRQQQIRHRLVICIAAAKVALQEIPDIDHKLHEQRLVQAVAHPERLHGGGIRLVHAGHDLYGVTRSQMHQKEIQDHHKQDGHQAGKEPAEHIPFHDATSLPKHWRI